MDKPFSDNQLPERILSTGNIRRAWKQVRANKGAPGIDGVSVEEFPLTYRERWPEIRSTLSEGTYVPSPVQRVEIPKPDGSSRPLGIPTVPDRIIQQAIARVMGPIFDPGFSESSCGFRPGRSARNGVRQVKRFIGQGYTVAVDMDLSKFFDTVNHDVLMNCVSRRIQDKRVLKLIGKYLRAGVMVNGRLQATPMGVPQGGPLSPLLANILYRKLAEYVRGWMNYYGISEYYRPIPGLDEWLRRRMRMCYWKQWRHVRTKVRNLLKPGTFKRQAIMTALSRKGPWHPARTLAAQTGMTNKWLAEQGLISVKELWVKIHYPATAR